MYRSGRHGALLDSQRESRSDTCPDSDTFDITRKPSGHLAFGHGIHHCVGVPPARMEMQIALPELAGRFLALRLAVSPDELTFRADSTTSNAGASSKKGLPPTPSTTSA